MLNELNLKQLWKELDEYEKELESDSKTLQEVWITIADLKVKTESESKKYRFICSLPHVF
jgi:hypothetical protein